MTNKKYRKYIVTHFFLYIPNFDFCFDSLAELKNIDMNSSQISFFLTLYRAERNKTFNDSEN